MLGAILKKGSDVIFCGLLAALLAGYAVPTPACCARVANSRAALPFVPRAAVAGAAGNAPVGGTVGQEGSGAGQTPLVQLHEPFVRSRVLTRAVELTSNT